MNEIVNLSSEQFTSQPRLVLEHGGFTVHAFRFPSGVEALDVRNRVGRAVLLPFQGQQIWDAEFLGRRLTMATDVDQPQPSRDYLCAYGAFFIHCGGTALGNPAADDDHPLHGELPNLPYARAWIETGADEQGAWIELCGEGTEDLDGLPGLAMRPSLRMYDRDAMFHMSFELENRSAAPLPVFYLGHVNFRPRDNARIVDAPPVPATGQFVRTPNLSNDTPAEIVAWHRAVNADPDHYRLVRPDEGVEPEFVATFRSPASADGWACAMQVHPDGTMDVVRHRPEELPYTVRWMVRQGRRQALGFALPANAFPDGRAAALRDGQGTILQPGERYSARFSFGSIPASG